MRAFVVVLFCLGLFLIINGIYQQKYEALKKNIHVEYRFIPKTYLEEQLASGGGNVSGVFKDNFNKADPWSEMNLVPKA